MAGVIAKPEPMSGGFAAIGLFSPKTEHNVGGVLRAAQCYGAAMVAVQCPRYRSCPTNTLKTERHIPLLVTTDLASVIPYGAEPIVVEITPDAVDLVTFQHPRTAFYILGPEDGSVPARFLKYRQVRIPTRFCMNLAATANVLLYDRLAKQMMGA